MGTHVFEQYDRIYHGPSTKILMATVFAVLSLFSELKDVNC